MKFDQLLVLLPCHSLEDFTLQREPAEAEQLLSAWCASSLGWARFRTRRARAGVDRIMSASRSFE